MGNQSTFLRAEEEGILSISRYLATVRLATFIPSAFRRVTNFWSDKGFAESSAAIRSRIRSRTASDAMASPSFVEMDELKKYFSFEETARGMYVFIGCHPRNRRLMHLDIFRYLLEDQRFEMCRAVLEEFFVEFEN